MTPSDGVIPPTFLYARVYTKYGKVKVIYTGITNNMLRRQTEHNKGLSITTNRYNKKYGSPFSIYYRSFSKREAAKVYEKMFKKIHQKRKLHIIKTFWKWWSG